MQRMNGSQTSFQAGPVDSVVAGSDCLRDLPAGSQAWAPEAMRADIRLERRRLAGPKGGRIDSAYRKPRAERGARADSKHEGAHTS